MIAFVAKRKVIADSRFLMINDGSARLKDIKAVYSTKLETKALSILQEYDASFILVNRNIQDSFNVDSISYLETTCFEKVYSKGFDIYKIKCKIGTGDSNG